MQLDRPCRNTYATASHVRDAYVFAIASQLVTSAGSAAPHRCDAS